MALTDDGIVVPNSTVDKEGRRVIRQFRTTVGLLDDGTFVFNLPSTAGAAVGRRLISPIGFKTDTTTVRY